MTQKTLPGQQPIPDAAADLPDAVLLVSFGGPRTRDDVMPFLRQVTRGKNVPDERLADVAEHYYARDGHTPINEQHEALRAALIAELAVRQIDLPIYLGNRNWDPYIVDGLRAAHTDGHRRILILPTSAYPSYSGCRQYREDVARAVAQLADEGVDGFDLTKVKHYYNTAGFITAYADAVREALGELDASVPARVAFVTHSIPVSMNESSGPDGFAYETTHKDAATQIMQRAGAAEVPWDLVYCSRSGPPRIPWTEPDVNDYIAERAGSNEQLVLVPSGFISDHMEVINDLDVEALEQAQRAGVRCVRARTALTHPAFVSSLADLLTGGRARICPAGCCPNLRKPGTPAVCGQEAPASGEQAAEQSC